VPGRGPTRGLGRAGHLPDDQHPDGPDEHPVDVSPPGAPLAASPRAAAYARREPSEGYRTRIAEMPDDERPRERLERLGAQALKTEELLAILLRTGTTRDDALGVAQRLLREHGGVRGLGGAHLPTLASSHGVGNAKASTIAAAFELGRRLSLDGGDARPSAHSPEGIVALLHDEMQF